jgi:biopolymer transport protein TolQ
MPHELGGPGTMGVADLLLGTGPVVQVVLWTLVLFSVVSWGIIIYKLNQISHARRESERFIALFWESKNLAAIHSGSVGLIHSPVAQVFRAGYQELLQLTRAKRQAVGAESGFSTDLGGVENVTRAMRRQANVETSKMEKGITFLATTGSTCPFIGLFGTVWGHHDGLHRALGGPFLKHPGRRPRHRRGPHHHSHRPGRRDPGADAL